MVEVTPLTNHLLSGMILQVELTTVPWQWAICPKRKCKRLPSTVDSVHKSGYITSWGWQFISWFTGLMIHPKGGFLAGFLKHQQYHFPDFSGAFAVGFSWFFPISLEPTKGSKGSCFWIHPRWTWSIGNLISPSKDPKDPKDPIFIYVNHVHHFKDFNLRIIRFGFRSFQRYGIFGIIPSGSGSPIHFVENFWSKSLDALSQLCWDDELE